MGIFFLVAIVLRGTMLWFVATLRIAILLAVAPLFIMFMLFNITKSYFESWLRQMMGAALTLIIVAASMALLIGLLTSQLQNLLNFPICKMVLCLKKNCAHTIDLSMIGLTYDIMVWQPSDSTVDTALSTKNLFSFLIFGAIFDSFSKQIPQICDILGKMGLGSIGAMYNTTGYGINRIRSAVVQGAGAAVSMAAAAAKGRGKADRPGGGAAGQRGGAGRQRGRANGR